LELHFPCEYVFKAFGPGTCPEFAVTVRQAVATVVPVPLDAMKIRQSGQGKYQAVSVVLIMHSLEQVHAVYQALKTVPDLQYLL
jgi:putative lipoic acid-binding regulatory protein